MKNISEKWTCKRLKNYGRKVIMGSKLKKRLLTNLADTLFISTLVDFCVRDLSLNINFFNFFEEQNKNQSNREFSLPYFQ
jgi:hypothetical protein